MNPQYLFYFCEDTPTQIDKQHLNVTDLKYIQEKNISFFYLFDLVFNIEKQEVGYYDDIILSNEILELLNKNRCTLIMNISYECTGLKDNYFVNFIKKFIDRYNLNFKNLKVLTGNLIHPKYAESLNCEFIPYIFFFDNLPFYNRDNPKPTYNDTNKINKKILCYNRVPRSHRKYLFYMIYQNKIIYDNISISLNNDCKWFNYQSEFDIDTNLNKTINNFFNVVYPQKWTIDNHTLSNDLSMNLEINDIRNHFLYLVTESDNRENILFITEKTFKPIFTKRPFIILGNPYTLKKLNEIGFKTFNKWWPEDYDIELNLTKRTDIILSLLDMISKKSLEELNGMLNDMNEVLNHNFNLLTKKHRPQFLNNLNFNYTKKIF